MRFEVGKSYETSTGKSVVRIVDANYKGKYLMGIVRIRDDITNELAQSFERDTGKLVGSNPPVFLVSDEPSEEEAEMMASIGDMVENGKVNDVELLKVIRRLRSKS